MAAFLLLTLAQQISAQAAAYGQCGGTGYVGLTSCVAGYTCVVSSSTYSQCMPAPIPLGDQSPWGRCGGKGYSGFTQCSAGYFCAPQSVYYSQCIPIPPVASSSFTNSAFGLANAILGSSSSVTKSPASSSATKLTSTSSKSALSSSSRTSAKFSSLSSTNSQKSMSLSQKTSDSTKKASSTSPSTSSKLLLSSSTRLTTVTSTSSKKLTSSSLTSSRTTKTSSFTLPLSTSSKFLTSSSTLVTTVTSKSNKQPTTVSTSTPYSKIVTTTLKSSMTSAISPISSQIAQQTPWGQCGGTGWTGPSLCATDWTCVPQAGNPWYSQCLPNVATSTVGGGPTAPAQPSTTLISITLSISNESGISPPTTVSPQPTSASPPSCALSNYPPLSAGKVSMAGINIAGCDFGTDTNGKQQPSGAYCPLGPAYYKPDGPGQMNHFATQDNFNVFRLPVGWQYITNNANTATGTLDSTNFAAYSLLVQQCLVTGAYCLIDIHNYARFNGAIIGQGGPSNAVFASLWASIATKYKGQSKVIFGLMNEPHDIPDISTWRDTVQAAVTAIRNAGATSQIILLPGNDWTSAESFITDGSGPALATVTNPDSTTTNLVFDIHKYLDSDGSGTSPDCVGNYISQAFGPLAQWLRCNGRMALLSETGGGSTSTCETYLCQAIAFLNTNSDVYLGYIGWAAGSFDPSYALAETPTDNNGVWTDTQIVTRCLVPKGVLG